MRRFPRQVLLSLALSGAFSAHATDWGSTWAWHQNTLTVQWGVSAAGMATVAVNVTRFDDAERTLTLAVPAGKQVARLTGGPERDLYCGIKVAIVLTLPDEEPQSVLLERPYNYPPAIAGLCGGKP